MADIVTRPYPAKSAAPIDYRNGAAAPHERSAGVAPTPGEQVASVLPVRAVDDGLRANHDIAMSVSRDT